MDYRLKSVGIAIGTTTTQLIVSELILKNRMPGSRIPNWKLPGKVFFLKATSILRLS
jgi:ethanolamine utilization protein EutA